MGRVLLIDRQPRIVDRRLVTAEAASCCCKPTDRYRQLLNCCDLQAYKVAPQSVIDQVLSACGLTDRQLDVIVRIDGDPACYRLGIFALTLEQVQTAGFPIVADANAIRCVPTSPVFPPERCYTETCPECSSDCCLIGLYRKNCPDLIADAVPKANVCCNYGRQATRIETYDTRITEEAFTSLNSSGSDPFCPPGCYSELLTRRSDTQESGTQTVRFTRCDDTGQLLNLVECLSGQHYRSSTGFRRRRAFLDPLPSDANCLTYDDVPDQLVENRFTGCIGMENEPPILAPPTFPPRPRYTVTTGTNGQPCVTINQGGDLLCQELNNHRSACVVVVSGGYREVETTITTFRMSVQCFQGSYFLEQTSERRAYGAECPADGSLVARRTFSHRATYSIQLNSRSLCPSSACDGFQREGDQASLPNSPLAPLPIEGALGFF